VALAPAVLVGVPGREVRATLAGSGPCYRLPYGHLTGFYGIIGFEEARPGALPPHLTAGLAQYRPERPGVNIYPTSCAPSN
jgi:hypothetical protein